MLLPCLNLSEAPYVHENMVGLLMFMETGLLFCTPPLSLQSPFPRTLPLATLNPLLLLQPSSLYPLSLKYPSFLLI